MATSAVGSCVVLATGVRATGESAMARRRDYDADFDDFFIARGPQLRRTAFAIVHDWHIAEDLVQASFVKVYVAWPRIQRQSLEAYTRRTVVNACISHLRKHQRERLTAQVPELAEFTDAAPGSDLLTDLATLSPAQRAVIALRYLDDLSVTQTSEALGISEGTVKSYAARGLAALRQHIPQTPIEKE